MTAMQTTADLAEPIDRIRDLKVADKVPLLFLDEFDSNVENYARLLPLMWDGKVDVGGRLLQTGKMIVVLAGSSPRIGELTEAARQMNDISKPTDGKLNDLLSRINGGELSIPALDDVRPPCRDRRVDKICLAIALIRQRFGKSLSHIPWALLRFVGDTRFKNGSRSISSLLELIPHSACTSGSLNLAELKLPLGSAEELTKSSLIYHISASTPGDVTQAWENLAKSSSMVKVADPDSFWTRLFEHVGKDPSFKALMES
jgi:hypothetical protein